jgi:hypothetical protein
VVAVRSDEKLMDLTKLPDDELIRLYPNLLKELRDRGIAKTRNLVGELGEYYAKKIYSETPNLPRLQDAPAGTKNVDHISVRGQRYAVKSTSGNITGVFSSLPLEDDGVVYFEYLIIVRFNNDYELVQLLECDWNYFISHRKIKNPEQRWYISLTNEFISGCTDIPLPFDEH